MKIRNLATVLLSMLFFAACEKNTVSKIPQIGLMSFWPMDSMKANVDTAVFQFSLVDGDADIGVDTASGIYLKDSRFPDLGFLRTSFPDIDISIEDPKKGIEGKVVFFPVPQPVPRGDTVHLTQGDTLSYELYITDRAGNKSNVISSPTFIVRPK